MKKRNYVVIAILLVLVLVLSATYSYARYLTSIDTSSDAVTAKWAVSVKEGSNELSSTQKLTLTVNGNENVVAGKIAPGSTATWGTSVLKDNINGAHFLTNTSTYPYLAVDTKWYKAIMLWNYSGLIRSSSSDVFLDTFEDENKAAKYSYKIGLMYLTDIGLGLDKSGLNVKVWRNSENPLIKSWLHQKNNDISVSNIEWTMSIYCNGCTHFYANGITAAGTVDAIRYEVTPYSSRPVFYLIDEMEYVSGTGTIGNPYIITNNNI